MTNLNYVKNETPFERYKRQLLAINSLNHLELTFWMFQEKDLLETIQKSLLERDRCVLKALARVCSDETLMEKLYDKLSYEDGSLSYGVLSSFAKNPNVTPEIAFKILKMLVKKKHENHVRVTLQESGENLLSKIDSSQMSIVKNAFMSAKYDHYIFKNFPVSDKDIENYLKNDAVTPNRILENPFLSEEQKENLGKIAIKKAFSNSMGFSLTYLLLEIFNRLSRIKKYDYESCLKALNYMISVERKDSKAGYLGSALALSIINKGPFRDYCISEVELKAYRNLEGLTSFVKRHTQDVVFEKMVTVGKMQRAEIDLLRENLNFCRKQTRLLHAEMGRAEKIKIDSLLDETENILDDVEKLTPVELLNKNANTYWGLRKILSNANVSDEAIEFYSRTPGSQHALWLRLNRNIEYNERSNVAIVSKLPERMQKRLTLQAGLEWDYYLAFRESWEGSLKSLSETMNKI